jgi:hypothetical protein
MRVLRETTASILASVLLIDPLSTIIGTTTRIMVGLCVVILHVNIRPRLATGGDEEDVPAS